MADLSAHIDFSVELDFITNQIKLTDPNNYPTGVDADLIGIFTITQPDGVTIAGEWTSPEIYYSTGALVQASRTLRLTGTNKPQEGTYIIKYEVDHPDYVPTVLTKTFELSYPKPTGEVTESFDVFTPELLLTDASNYAVTGFAAPTITRAWDIDAGTVGTVTGSSSSLDLAISGNYYDAVYTGQLLTSVLYQHQTYAYLTLRDRHTFNISTAANTPPSISGLLTYLKAIKARLDASISCSQSAILKGEYEYAFVLYRHIRDRACAGDTLNLDDYIKEFLNIYYQRRYTYVNTNAIIPAYDTDGACGGGSGSGTGQTVTMFEYIIGTTSGAPTAGSATFAKTEFADASVLVLIGKVPQSQIDDGSGSYYTKVLASDTVTLTGMTWETGTLVQFMVITEEVSSTPSILEYKIGTTSGAPTAGAATFTNSDLLGRNVWLIIGKFPQSKLDDGSGSYYTKTLSSDTLTLTGMTWETGTVVQFVLL